MVVSKLHRPLTAFVILCVVALLGLTVLFDFGRASVTDFAHRYFSHGTVSADPWVWFIYFLPYLRLLEFISGMLAARTYQTDSIKGSRFAGPMLLYGLAWCGGAVLIGITANPPIVQSFIFAPGIALTMLCVCQQKNALSRVLSSPQMLFLGEISIRSMYGRFL